MPTMIRLLLAPLAAVALLSACTIEVFIGTLTDETVSTSEFVGTPLTGAGPADTVTLGPSEQYIYRVDVSSTAQPALYLFLDEELEMFVYDANGAFMSASASADFFAESSAVIASASASPALAPQAVTSALACPGSCVIQRTNQGSPRYVRVTNTGSTSVSFGFYAVTRGFEDEGEAASSAVPIPTAASGDFAAGALETLGDVDVFVAQDSGTLFFDPSFTPPSGLIYEAEITDPFDLTQPAFRIRNGESAAIQLGEEVRVYAVNATDRAASSANSTYFLDID